MLIFFLCNQSGDFHDNNLKEVVVGDCFFLLLFFVCIFFLMQNVFYQVNRPISLHCSQNYTVFFFPSHCALKKLFGFSSCVKPFAQQKWFLVASKTKCSEHSRKHINRLILFLRLWSIISPFFLYFSSCLTPLPSVMLSISRQRSECSVWKSWLSFSILLGFALVTFSE